MVAGLQPEEMPSVEEYRSRLLHLVSPTPVVATSVGGCAGLVLTTSITAPIPLPPFDNAAMDGYAVRASDPRLSHTETPRRPVRRGFDPGWARGDRVGHAEGTAWRIMTGAPVPTGADAVIPFEDACTSSGSVRMTSPVTDRRRHVREAGEDVGPGDTVLRAGQRLGAAALGVAAALGIRLLPVHRRARVAVVATGSELAPRGAPLRAGQVHDVNGPLLEQALRAAGSDVVRRAVVSDSTSDLRRVPDEVRQHVDLIITAGGISAGDHEVVRDTLAPGGVWFGRIRLRSGAPQGHGTYRGVPIIALPGNPVAAWVGFHVLVRPVVRAAAGGSVDLVPTRLPLLDSVRSRAGAREYRLAAVTIDAVRGAVAAPLPGGSHRVGVLASSNALITLPEGTTEVLAGTQIDVLRTETDD